MSVFNVTYKSIAELPAQTGNSVLDSDSLLIQTSTGTKRIAISELRLSGAFAATVPINSKNVANGYAGLDANAQILDAQIPSSIVRQTTLSSALAPKADTATVNSSLSLKANTTDVNSALALKANTSDVNTALSAKADQSAVNTSLSTKADQSVLTSGLSTKLDHSGFLTSSSNQLGFSSGSTRYLNISNQSVLTFYLGGDQNKPIVLQPVPLNNGNEWGISIGKIKCSEGRFDFDPADDKAEFRVSGTNTQFGIWGTALNQFYMKIAPDRTADFYGPLRVNSSGSVAAWIASDGTVYKGSGTTNPYALTSQITPGQVGNGSAQWNANQLQSKPITISSPVAGQILSYNGSAWVNVSSGSYNPSNVSITGGAIDGTTIGATTPSTIKGTTGTFSGAVSASSLTLTTALPVTQGGTGSTSAAAARTALGIDPATAQYNASKLQSQTVASTTPVDGAALVYRSGSWAPSVGTQILQVVSKTVTASFSSSSTTLASWGLNATITPRSTSSKILVLINASGLRRTGNLNFIKSILNRTISGTTSSIAVICDGLGYTALSDSSETYSSASLNYLDSPATTSAVTYDAAIGSGSNGLTIVANQNGTCSNMVLIELL